MSGLKQSQWNWIVKVFREKLATGQQPEAIRDYVQSMLEAMMDLGPEEAETAVSRVEAEFRDETVRVRNIGGPTIGGEGPGAWYVGPSEEDRFWPGLRRHLVEQKGWTEDTVDSIDRESTGIVARLHPPGRDRFSGRGLVVGHIQSGKTANMTAVMAKAVDSGYRFVIVLAGLTDSLRAQTQERMDADLVSIDRDSWDQLTSREQDFDPGARSRLTPPQNGAVLAVVKKNTHVLASLRNVLSETGESVRSALPALVIDDETDQASPDVSRRDRDTDPSTINLRIREILNLLPRVSYVGYTATPFANVLINPSAEGDGVGYDDDLYPRDFIVSLPAPRDYMGPEVIFGRDMTSADEVPPEESGLNVVRKIPEVDLEHLGRLGEGPESALPESLESAILWFALATATLQMREASHCTMLVHTSRLTNVHEVVRNAIADRILDLTAESRTNLTRRLESIWVSEYGKVDPEPFGNPRADFGEIAEFAVEVLNQLRVVEDNYVSNDQIEFPEDGEPVWAIITGGDRLSRGVTLPGLLVSYFARQSSQYDTLLQMGRWFGFRRGHEELPRIWMPARTASHFRELATIEQEIREDIEVYAKTGMTPVDWGIRIRQVPGMLVTRRPAMQSARQTRLSYSGEHLQTIRFYHRDREWLRRNWDAGSELLAIADGTASRVTSPLGDAWHGVEVDHIIRFLKRYRTCEEQHRTNTDALIQYIEQFSRNELAVWNIGVISTREGTPSEAPLGPIGHPGTIRRSRIEDSPDDCANIKALMSKSDIFIDTEDRPSRAGSMKWRELKELRRMAQGRSHRPLLLLYPVNRVSPASERSKDRIDLEATHDVLGMALVFPEDPHGFSGHYVTVDLDEVAPAAGDDE